MTRKTNNRSIRFESLESRQLMAGDVTASVVNDELFLTGDNSGNSVEVHQVAGNLYKVKGLDGTTINGKEDKLFSFKKGIHGDFKGGNDNFSMGGVVFVDDVDGVLDLKMGAGKDRVSLGRVDIAGDTTIDTSTEDDVVNLGAFGAFNKVTVNTGLGADSVTLNTSFAKQMNVTQDAGEDKFSMFFSTVESLKVDSGAGDDNVELFIANSLGNIDIATGSEKDTVKLQAVVATGNINVDTAAGDDTVSMLGSTDAVTTNLKTGANNDVVDLNGATVRTVLNIDTADGLDSVTIKQSKLEQAVDIKTGLANDVVEINTVVALRNITIDTDAGDDKVDLLDLTATGRKIDVKTGDNEDVVNLTRVVADQFFADLGKGDDEIRIRNSTFRVTKLDGNAGSDKFFDLIGNSFGTLTLEGFN